MNVKEAAKRAGVSVRALRYYEEAGLIRPERNSENNYREYDDAAVERARLIHAYRELQFPLEQIRGLLDMPRAGRDALLQKHVERLREQRKKIDNRIAIVEAVRMIGPARIAEINFAELDDQIEQAQRFLDQNDDMRALSEKFRGWSKEQEERMAAGLIERIAAVAAAPEAEVFREVEALRAWVEENFYPCTDGLLRVYARAYGGDGLLAREIEGAAGPGAPERLRERLERYLAAG